MKEWKEGEVVRTAEKEDMMFEYRHAVTCWENLKARSAWKKTRFNLPKLKMPTFDKAAHHLHMKDFMAGGGGVGKRMSRRMSRVVVTVKMSESYHGLIASAVRCIMQP